MKKTKSKGFVIVATKKKGFYRSAINLAESVKDFWPEADITLFTHEDWIEQEDRNLFDKIITKGIPNHIRAKLWALNKTPYDITCYLDADMHCEHEDIKDVFDLLPDHLDVVFTKNRPYNSALTTLSETEEMTCHCGFFVYRKNPEIMSLMGAWYTEYLEQQKPEYDMLHYPESAKKWDTFTMWRLLTYGEQKIKWGYIEPPDARWNFVNGYLESELQGTEVVLFHHTIPKDKQE